jgi:glucose/arabinose dehydrogenase
MTIMRPIRSIATALLIASLAVAGCARSQPDQTPPPADQPPAVTATPAPKAQAPTDGPATSRQPVVLADGRHPVRITTVDPDRRTVTFDLIQFYWGDDATREAAKDHQESPPPNDYYIRNVNPRLRTLPVTRDATITTNTLTAGYTGSATKDIQVPLWRLTILLPSSYSPPFWITVHHGQVVKLAEQYIP